MTRLGKVYITHSFQNTTNVQCE